jgi:hypothetical protein
VTKLNAYDEITRFDGTNLLEKDKNSKIAAAKLFELQKRFSSELRVYREK